MRLLHQLLAERVQNWRKREYYCEDFPAISEILEDQMQPETQSLSFLRKPQFRALETYWYLRLVENTPHIFDLYQRIFPRGRALREALGLADESIRDYVEDYGIDALWERIKTDDAFIRTFKLHSLRETLTLQYPSYIFALAMGAGKTVMIGAIIASEFAMALEYPDAPFVQNALVFAPGKTIIESLRELAETPYHRILPPRFYKAFAASVKLTFTRDGEKDIPIINGSCFNIVITNTEKIRIQRENIRRSDIGTLFVSEQTTDEARAEIANLRLQKIASLPNLAIFSDEAHHTYGQALDTELKKVRKTVDYLAANTRLLCVVNTTGTPYFKRQPLRDVVIWYGLSEGIHDGILKEVAGNIHGFSFGNESADRFVAHVIEDFLKDYGHVTLPNGALAKLALYFPQTDDLEELRPVIEAKLTELGYSPALCLRNTSDSTTTEMNAFNRLNDPDAPQRVILLVNKGTEGWNCPSLFACALARRLRSSNNFVLQAASRCLRQVPGNVIKARIYLSMDNRNTLDRELQETYGETIAQLNQAQQQSCQAIIRLRKLSIPPLVVKQPKRTVVRKEVPSGPLALSTPRREIGAVLQKFTFTISEQAATGSVLRQLGDVVEITGLPDTISVYAAAVELAAVYRLNFWMFYDTLKHLYDGASEMPTAHLPDLAHQVEEQTRHYEVREEVAEVALAMINHDGFTRGTEEGRESFIAEITYPKDREYLLLPWDRLEAINVNDFGFHYTPYNFDSYPELSFFEQLLFHANQQPDEVEDIYFTGALTNPSQTDFYMEYKGDDGKSHRYTPDFMIRRKDGKCLIVEIKDGRFEAATREDLARDDRGEASRTGEGRKALALKKWERLNPQRVWYELIYARESTVGYDQTKGAREFIQRK